jgi:hypothetical protein
MTFAVFISSVQKELVEERRADLDRCAVYVSLFSHEYGFADAGGVSPTEPELGRRCRIVYTRYGE